MHKSYITRDAAYEKPMYVAKVANIYCTFIY